MAPHMNTILTVGCTITSLLAMLFGWLYYRQMTRAALQHRVSEARLAELAGELNAKKAYLSELLNVLYGSAGAIDKRLNESAEIASALQSHGPEVLRKCSGLAFWLHANDQFLLALAKVAGENVMREDQPHRQTMLTKNREGIFRPLYDAAGLGKNNDALQVLNPTFLDSVNDPNAS